MRRLLIFAVAMSLLVAACGGGGGDVAATVGDSEITVSDVESVPFEAGGTIDANRFAQYLGVLIQLEILDNAAAEEFSVDPSEEDVEAELDSFLENEAGGMSMEEVAQAQNFSEDMMRRLMRVRVIQEQVSEKLGEDLAAPSDDEVSQALDDQKAGLTEVCVRHVLVATEEEAEEARERLQGGEEFETVASEMSSDPSAEQNGGDLGCAPAQQYVPEFRDAAVEAEIDAITEPIQSQFGFHVLQVYDRTGPSAEEVPTEQEVEEMLNNAAETRALQEWLLEKLDTAEVTVDEEYGTWVTTPQPMVQPPSAGTPGTPGTTVPSGTSGPSETTAPDETTETSTADN